MPTQTRNLLIVAAIVIVVSAGLGAAGGGTLLSGLMGFLLGGAAWFILTMVANNRAEAGVPAADRATALATPPEPGMGLVYLYRDGFLGRALGYDIELDGVTVAQLRSPRFVRLSLAAGAHTLAAGPRGTLVASQNAMGRGTFTLAPGETIVFALKPRIGATQNQIELRRELDPRAALTKLAAMPMVRPETAINSRTQTP